MTRYARKIIPPLVFLAFSQLGLLLFCLIWWQLASHPTPGPKLAGKAPIAASDEDFPQESVLSKNRANETLETAHFHVRDQADTDDQDETPWNSLASDEPGFKELPSAPESDEVANLDRLAAAAKLRDHLRSKAKTGSEDSYAIETESEGTTAENESSSEGASEEPVARVAALPDRMPHLPLGDALRDKSSLKRPHSLAEEMRSTEQGTESPEGSGPQKDVVPNDSKPRLEKEPLRTIPKSTPSENRIADGAEQSVMAFPAMPALERRLDQLAANSRAARQWATEVSRRIKSLQRLESIENPKVAQTLEALRVLATSEASGIEPRPEVSAEWKQVEFALRRRLAVWQAAHVLARAPLAPAVHLNSAALAEQLQAVRVKIQSSSEANAWQRYLLLNELSAIAQAGPPKLPEAQLVAVKYLERLESRTLSREQEKLLSEEPFKKLAQSLHPIAASRPDLKEILSAMEQHEDTPSAATARTIAKVSRQLSWSDDPPTKSLADALEQNYRGSNLRFGLSIDLVNRFLPEPTHGHEPVAETVRGARVFGRSGTTTRLRLQLLPDRSRWRMALEAEGDVVSDTTSSKGPARFRNEGFGFFRARKSVAVDRNGITVSDTEAAASTTTELRNFETDFDDVPIVGAIARMIAKNQFEAESPMAKREIEQRMTARVEDRFDQEIYAGLANAQKQLQKRVIDPLDQLRLHPTPIGLETTEKRILGRYRLASPWQASAPTPRPQAPANSYFSIQLHESVVSNVLDNLALADRKVSVDDLYLELAKRFGATDAQLPEDLPEGVVIQFASEDPIRVEFLNDEAHLTIRIRELSMNSRNHWEDFTVTAVYKPGDQVEWNLEREGSPVIHGQKLRQRDKLALLGIFSKALANLKRVRTINEFLANDRRLADLEVTQFLFREGWLGVALAPHIGPRDQIVNKGEPTLR